MLDDLRLLARPLRQLLTQLAAFFAARGVVAYAQGGFLRDALLGARTATSTSRSTATRASPAAPSRTPSAATTSTSAKRCAGQRPRLPAHDLQIDLPRCAAALEDDLRARDYTVNALAAPLAEAAAGSAAADRPDRRPRRPCGAASSVSWRAGARRRPAAPFARRSPRCAARFRGRACDRRSDPQARRASTGCRARAAARRTDAHLRAAQRRRRPPSPRRLALLDVLLPEAACRGVEQPKEHHHDVLGHSFAAVEALDMLHAEIEPDRRAERARCGASSGRISTGGSPARLLSRGDRPRTPRLARSSSSPPSCTTSASPRRSPSKSPAASASSATRNAGAEIARRILRRLRFSARETGLVRGWSTPTCARCCSPEGPAHGKRAVYRLFRDTADAGLDVLFLSLADHLGTVGPRADLDGWRRHVGFATCSPTAPATKPRRHPPLPVNGDDLMAAFDLPPGHKVGELLNLIREAHAAGEVDTKEEAIALARDASLTADFHIDPRRPKSHVSCSPTRLLL